MSLCRLFLLNQSKVGTDSDAHLNRVDFPNKNSIYIENKKMWFQYNDGNDNFGWVNIQQFSRDGHNHDNSYYKKTQSAFTYNNETPKDINWVTTPGVYVTNESTVGAPSNNGVKTYGILIVFSCTSNGFNGGNWVVQFWTPTTSLNGGQLFMRKSINATNGGGWSTWHKISTTEYGIG